MVKNLLIWGIIAVVLIAVFNQFSSISNSGPQINYTQFNSDITSGKIQEVHINGREIIATTKDNRNYVTYIPYFDEKLMDDLVLNKVAVYGSPDEKPSLLASILISWFPIILLIGFWIFVMRQMQGGGKGGPMSVGKSKARMLAPDQVKTKFTDVAGSEEAKQEVTEVVDFLRDPGKYQKLGGRIPKGILMVGPPGTGKTLLARAIAGEANVPFFSISGSDFVEMFVGVGASRVRDLFEQARKHSPCIIFIDEIDAVGRKRGAGSMGGHDEREQTLNQMLVEMDGFEANSGIIMIAATNRADILDPALLRPGRFDRQVQIDLPDLKSREQILAVHVRKVPLGSDVNLAVLARGTPNYSGAQLANLVNEAALFAARRNKRLVTMDEFEEAKDKIDMGTQRRSLSMTKEQLTNTAYHEAGHAIVGYLMPDHDPLHKVTIIPRGGALGVAFFLPEGDQISQTRTQLESKISTAYAGRIAEGLIYGEDKITSGASSDIRYASNVARAMVTQWGFSDRLPPALFEYEESSYGVMKKISDGTAKIIDEEVDAILQRNYQRAKTTLTENIDILHAMKDALLKYETIDKKQIDELMNRQPVTPPEGWTASDEKAAQEVPNEGRDTPPESDD
ncbi:MULTISPECIES: ATP-dependent zinc metalloprotease FtsH [unclassified Gilliamella]|uniref:ATP-dependent zinc metalloprotease FtsH n=1 Tax=unclassified Gilliamella TaxID=2685620 RepID=UPI00226A4EAC|nr:MULTISPECIES: ATP-dependent zinc metalloprotease FtsH [unclassified Gilliamella]MCX8575494.1 ATP-dependent zinc metalloprotease FtsH [Gilliamella sp. B3831]MCX8577745.1 ATP-dependent zinc metalloprotease FtsH [Gilliamella sp. B3815]MCX8590691.1 ATP-dependent zinc metalloprotease FtsH [Gilliamella sp. B3812]MCX8604844.1 ATP-dependent zinc metalloprotease FtsH [Gilliamella sp. B3823]MCX8605568.1 ATP-dependent zinc metalloprotease FtsH [Gilliamella sp. B3825]